MRWNAKPPKPFIPKWTERRVDKFAWIPTKVNGRVWVWLEMYVSVQYWKGTNIRWKRYSNLAKDKK